MVVPVYLFLFVLATCPDVIEDLFCLRVAVFTVISIQRMRYVVRLWRQRRRAIEAQPSSD